MAQDSTKMQLGACDIKADGSTLGYTIGTVTVEWTDAPVFDSATQAPGPMEGWTAEQGIKVTGQFAQVADQGTLLGYIRPDATVSGDAVSGGRQPGYRFSASAFTMLIHPLDQGSTTTYDLTIYKAISTLKTKLAYTKEGIRVYDFEFIGLYDDSRTDGDRIWKLNASADSSAPTRSSTSPTDGAASQEATVNIVVTFNEAMSYRTLVDDSGHSPVVVFDSTNESVVACAATVTTTTYANDTLTLNPDSSLTAGATIYVLVPEFVKDQAGNAHAGSQSDFAVAA